MSTIKPLQTPLQIHNFPKESKLTPSWLRWSAPDVLRPSWSVTMHLRGWSWSNCTRSIFIDIFNGYVSSEFYQQLWSNKMQKHMRAPLSSVCNSGFEKKTRNWYARKAYKYHFNLLEVSSVWKNLRGFEWNFPPNFYSNSFEHSKGKDDCPQNVEINT